MRFTKLFPEIMSKKSYHDYVIKDGKFIGEFDKMYKEVKDPWMQSQQPNQEARKTGIDYIKRYNVRSILEAGCGLGYYAKWIYNETGVIPISIDLSPTAIERAKMTFPDLNFLVADITKELDRFKEVECVLLSEVLWYILSDLDQLLDSLKYHYNGKLLIINQVFYKGTQQYGTDYFTNVKELIDYIPYELIDQFSMTEEDQTTIETSTIYRIN